MKKIKIAATLLLLAGCATPQQVVTTRSLAAPAHAHRPPPGAPVEPAEFPPVREARLANGMKLLVVEQARLPVVTALLTLPAGSAHDPAGKEGLAGLVAQTLTKGAAGRTAEQVAADIERVGGTIGAGVDADVITLWADVLAPDAALAFELLADAVTEPAFAPGEVELARTQALSGLQFAKSQPAQLATREFERRLYANHPYGRQPDEESVRAVTRDDLAAFAERHLRPSEATLVIAGDLSLAEARRLAQQHFGAWEGTAPGAPRLPHAPARGPTEIVLVHRPGSSQSNIVAGNPAFPAGDSLRYAAIVANHVLGGGSEARLFSILREQKGWTYGTGSSFNLRRGAGYFVATAAVRPEVTDSALAELLDQIRRLGQVPIPAAELETAKSNLTGTFPLQLQTTFQLASEVRMVDTYDLPEDYLRTYLPRVDAVGADEARRAARAAMKPDSALVVVVGDAPKVYEQLQAIAPVTIVDVEGDPIAPESLLGSGEALPADPAALEARQDSFAVQVQGNALGFQTTALEATDQGFQYTEETQIGPAVRQKTTIRFGPGLEPIAVQQSGTVQGQETKVDVVYRDGRAKGSAKTPGALGIQEVAVDAAVPVGAIDDNMLQALLPALPWNAGASWTFPVFLSGKGEARNMTLAVEGRESISVPAGDFEVFRAGLTGGDQPVIFFVTAAPPHRLVKIAIEGTPLEIVRVR